MYLNRLLRDKNVGKQTLHQLSTGSLTQAWRQKDFVAKRFEETHFWSSCPEGPSRSDRQNTERSSEWTNISFHEMCQCFHALDGIFSKQINNRQTQQTHFGARIKRGNLKEKIGWGRKDKNSQEQVEFNLCRHRYVISVVNDRSYPPPTTELRFTPHPSTYQKWSCRKNKPLTRVDSTLVLHQTNRKYLSKKKGPASKINLC